MKTISTEQQHIFDSEINGLSPVNAFPTVDKLEALGFRFNRYHSLKNFMGWEAELEIFLDDEENRIVRLCVTQPTQSEGDLLHQQCFIPKHLLHAFKVNIEESIETYRF